VNDEAYEPNSDVSERLENEDILATTQSLSQLSVGKAYGYENQDDEVLNILREEVEEMNVGEGGMTS
jgi:hypothetical protein